MNAIRHAQQGAALAIALLILVIITLLGVAAVRATQMELKLSRNAESRMAAVQAADSMVAFVSRAPQNLPVDQDQTYRACQLPSTVTKNLPLFTCAAGDKQIDVDAAAALVKKFGYAEIKRETPLFVETTVLRDVGISSKNYDFARFTVTGGYDHSQEGMSAAEVIEGILRLHTKVSGVSYE